MSFVGCHMDVVTANPDSWTFDPFTLGVEGDQLRGRGTTDCLGHVALVTEFFRCACVCIKGLCIKAWRGVEGDRLHDRGKGSAGQVLSMQVAFLNRCTEVYGMKG